MENNFESPEFRFTFVETKQELYEEENYTTLERKQLLLQMVSRKISQNVWLF